MRLDSWLLAAGGTFGGLLLRPGGDHPLWGVRTGFLLQVAGLILAIGSLVALAGRSGSWQPTGAWSPAARTRSCGTRFMLATC